MQIMQFRLTEFSCALLLAVSLCVYECMRTCVCADTRFSKQLAEYRSSLGMMGQDSNAHYTGEAYSVWDGSYAFGKHKEKAMFVDENACIGCLVRVCVRLCG